MRDPAALTPSSSPARSPAARRARLLPLVIWLVVAALLGLFFYGLTTPRLPAGLIPNRGTPARDFQLTTFDGKPVQLAQLRGRPVVLNFWASWCPPCRDEQPDIERVWQQYQNKGIVFLGIDIQDHNQDGLRYLQQYGLSYLNAPDPTGQVYIDYGVVGMPETFFITRDGAINRKVVGPMTASDLTGYVEEILQ